MDKGIEVQKCHRPRPCERIKGGADAEQFFPTLPRAEPEAMAFTGSPFHVHLTALTTEYEKIMAENAELRQQLHKASSLESLESPQLALWV